MDQGQVASIRASTQQLLDAAPEAGVNVVEKPFTGEDLARRIRELLDG